MLYYFKILKTDLKQMTIPTTQIMFDIMPIIGQVPVNRKKIPIRPITIPIVIAV
jgi:hypothetical protein